MVIELLDKARAGDLHVQSASQDFTEVRDEIRSGFRRTVLAIIGTGCLIGAAVLLAPDGSSYMLGDVPLAVWLLGIVGVGFLATAVRDSD